MNRFLTLTAPALAFLLGIETIGCGSSNAAYQECVASVPRPASSSGSTATASSAPVDISLATVDAAAFAASVKQSFHAQMAERVEAYRYQAVVSARCSSLQQSGSDYADNATAAAPTASGAGNATSSPGANEVSTTNNQVAGVDEADFVKNDSQYIYVVNGGKFRIIQAWPAPSAHEVGNVPIDGTALKLFVSGDRALVYSSVNRSARSNYSDGGSSGCSYGYDCDFTGDGTGTVISIFDVANRAAPTLLRKITTSSSLLAARRVGNTVHTVLTEAPIDPTLSSQAYVPDLPAKPSEDEINAAYDALLRANDARIASADVSQMLPTIDAPGAAPTRSLYQSQLPDGAQFTTVLSLDMSEATPDSKAVTIISRPGAVFAAADALYVAVPHERSWGGGWYGGAAASLEEVSTVHKFALGATPSDTDYRASGAVKGRVLNQFSMDEKDGNLRIATTTGRVPSPDVTNTLSMLADQGGQLGVIGQIDGIATGEDIRSVRFDGDRGYMVTFKKTDPLYVFDLSDPHAPIKLGELAIPGFSVYMHMMDATHLLTIGYDAADQGDFAWFTGVILQIFDVTDPNHPALTHKESIGTRGSSSEALADHLAFNYFAPKNVLAIPMTVCEGGDANGDYGTKMSFSGLMVYDVTAQAGFSLRGEVSHPTAQSGNAYDDVGCTNWWANATSEVKRSIFMDDYVFSISERRIKVNALSSLATDLEDISIVDPSAPTAQSTGAD